MDPKQLLVDERLKGISAYCQDIPNTRDYVPSRTFLNKPYPENIHVLDAC